MLRALFSVALLGLVACAGAPDADDASADEASALVVPAAARLGSMTYGESRTTAYTASPRYRAWSFSGAAGDDIEVRVTSPDGDPVAWLTSASFGTLARADDVSTSDRTAVIHRTLAHAGTYWIVTSEAKRNPATLNVSLTKRDDEANAGGPVVIPDAAAPAGPRLSACSDSNRADCLRLAGTCYDHFACPVQGFTSVTKINGAFFHFSNGVLTGMRGGDFDSSYVSGDDLEEGFFRVGHILVVDGQEHGIATTFHRNDVYATASQNGEKLTVTVRLSPTPGSPYTAQTCSHPKATAGGYCTFTNLP